MNEAAPEYNEWPRWMPGPRFFPEVCRTMKFDLHLHTSRHSPDSETDPFDLLAAACKAGLDGVALTEHDYLWATK